MKAISQRKCFGGVQGVYEHASEECQCPMRFGVFVPRRAESRPAPVLTFLASLTCTEENFIVKAGARRVAAELGVIVVAPDTSPRGDDVADAKDDYDMGKGAGFSTRARRTSFLAASFGRSRAQSLQLEAPGASSRRLSSSFPRKRESNKLLNLWWGRG